MRVLSEESKIVSYNERKKWNKFWIVDPLDGTKEFIKRNGEFTVNIAMINKNRPVLGVIYIPVKDKIYYAAEGEGALKLDNCKLIDSLSAEVERLKEIDNSPGDVAEKKRNCGTDGAFRELFSMITSKSVRLPLKKSTPPVFTVVGSRSHAKREFEEFLKKMKRKYKEVDYINAGSSLKFCIVAEGQADIYPRFGPTMEWDSAAGQIIVDESGGCVLDIKKNEPLRYNKEELINPWFIAKGAFSRFDQ
jgi:3'(2'), 5'-bisphosphate nucleotidase